MSLLKQIFSQNAHWQINKDFAREFGIECAILISDLVDKSLYFGEEWFFNTSENIQKDTTLSRFQQDKAIKILIEKGFIETKLLGIPAKKNFKIIENNLLNFFATSIQKTNDIVCEKLANLNDSNLQCINNNKYKENKEIKIKNKTALPKNFSFYNSLIDYGFEKNLVSDWIAVRKTKKATNTETAFKNFISEIEKRTCNLNEILEFIVIKNWSGFKWSWYDAEKEKEKSSAKKEKENEPLVIGRQTMSTVLQNLDTSGIYNPWLENKNT